MEPAQLTGTSLESGADELLNKVPQVTLLFWIMKICATTLGETAGDLVAQTLKVGYAVSSLVLIGIFLVALAAQLAGRKFHPSLYWTVILATSTAGTTISDYMDRTLKLGYAAGSLILVSTLALVLVIWRLTEGTLSVDHIGTKRAEVFYWVAILVSNTLGTALGDYLADSSGLGFLGGAALVGSLIGVTVLAHFFTRVNKIFLFWVAFVLTRPFGATFGDLMTKPVEKGGLNFGTAGSSAVLAAILVALVVYSQRRPKGAFA